MIPNCCGPRQVCSRIVSTGEIQFERIHGAGFITQHSNDSRLANSHELPLIGESTFPGTSKKCMSLFNSVTGVWLLRVPSESGAWAGGSAEIVGARTPGEFVTKTGVSASSTSVGAA
eukprot:m.865644 g.865644  ORF g.865644 m.865644 type:complete len:117 (+) comp59719_c1_seq8:2100-2450(+)